MNRTLYISVLDEIRNSVMPGLDLSQTIMQEVAREAPGSLGGYLEELINRKGKRMRATYVLLLATSSGKPLSRRASRVASSIELLHLATLVHDDIIDASDLRRNELTAHRMWGPRVAVLVGDYALAKALELIIEDEERQIPSSISRAASRLVAGEVLEIERSGRLNLSLEQYFEVIYGKTASLWETCGQCGALLAGFEPALVKSCTKMGKNMGMAFQMIDDLLDYGIGAGDLGKETNNDLENGLVTLPLIYFFNKSEAGDKDSMRQLLQDAGGPGSRSRILELLERSGSFQDTKDAAMARIRSCLGTLEQFPETRSSAYLRELCELIGHRST